MTKILAIDDNNDNLIALGAIIKDSFPDSVFDAALSGKEGIELAISTDPDVILLDIIMPEMDGFEVCFKLKQDKRTRDIPVVFLTAMKEDRQTRIKALEIGGDAFLYKPIDDPELVAQIRVMLKIKEFNSHKRDENKRLLQLVAERTQELEQSQAATLKLLNEQKAENEKYRNKEKELKESEEKYRLLHESAGVGIGYYTPEGTIISYNRIAALNMNGKPEDFAGKSIYTLFPKEDADFYMDRIKKSMNSESRQEYEDKVELPTGVKWFHSVFTRIQDSSNQVVGVQIISTDITERKKIEDKLRESEEKFHSLYANMSEGSALHTLIYNEGVPEDYRIIEINPTFETLLGISKEAVINKTSREAYGVEEPPFFEIYSRVALAGEPEVFETYFVPLDKHFSVSVYCPSKGSFATIFENITERKHAEIEKERTQKLLEDSQRIGKIGGWEIDIDTMELNWTKEMYDIHEVDLTFKPMVDDRVNFYTPESLPIIDKAVHDAIKQGGSYEVDLEIITAKGNRRSIKTIGKADLKSRRVVGLFQDITDRKQAEEKLIEEQLFNHAIIENLPGIFYLYTYPELQLIKWNKNHETMLDLTAQELKNRFSASWRRPEVKDHVISLMNQVAKTGYGQTEASFYKKNGSEIPFILTGVRLDMKGQTFIMGFGIDITDRKKTEEALKESDLRLRELVATKDKFFSIIAHDLKSPFNSILGLSNLLVEQIREKNYNGVEEYAGIIQKSSATVFNLLINLLEWARLQTGRMEFSPEYVEIGALINETAELLNDTAQQKSITIIKGSPRNILVYADKAMISTIFRNLISNAIKFTYPDGQIIITADKKPDELIISISDNGIGIKKEAIGRLFRIDETLTALGTQNEKGTGLGLILCKEFIEKHGGKIWVESVPGTGSTFYFTLPCN